MKTMGIYNTQWAYTTRNGHIQHAMGIYNTQWAYTTRNGHIQHAKRLTDTQTATLNHVVPERAKAGVTDLNIELGRQKLDQTDVRELTSQRRAASS